MASHRLAGVLFVFAALVYLASGSVVPDSHDTTANAYVPVSLLGDGDLAFGALEAPLMFLWKAKDAQGTTPVYVQSWAHRGQFATTGGCLWSDKLEAQAKP